MHPPDVAIWLYERAFKAVPTSTISEITFDRRHPRENKPIAEAYRGIPSAGLRDPIVPSLTGNVTRGGQTRGISVAKRSRCCLHRHRHSLVLPEAANAVIIPTRR
jgi:hypothetical protein